MSPANTRDLGTGAAFPRLPDEIQRLGHPGVKIRESEIEKPSRQDNQVELLGIWKNIVGNGMIYLDRGVRDEGSGEHYPGLYHVVTPLSWRVIVADNGDPETRNFGSHDSEERNMQQDRCKSVTQRLIAPEIHKKA